MSWAHESHRYDDGMVTWHRKDGEPSALTVSTTPPGGPVATHVVHMPRSSANASHAGMWFPSGQDQSKAFVMDHTGASRYAPAPSESLRSLIEHHHHTGAWMPLLDQLVTEYPELAPAVESHTAARAS